MTEKPNPPGPNGTESPLRLIRNDEANRQAEDDRQIGKSFREYNERTANVPGPDYIPIGGAGNGA